MTQCMTQFTEQHWQREKEFDNKQSYLAQSWTLTSELHTNACELASARLGNESLMGRAAYTLQSRVRRVQEPPFPSTPSTDSSFSVDCMTHKTGASLHCAVTDPPLRIPETSVSQTVASATSTWCLSLRLHDWTQKKERGDGFWRHIALSNR